MSKVIRIGLVGLGKIARDEHLPAIALTEGAELVAVASRNAVAEGVANYPSLKAMLASRSEVDAVVLCQPPQARFESARAALLAGKHVFLEKPPGATLSEVELLVDLAHHMGVTLFASWHSRYSPLVAKAREWCVGRNLTSIRIDWKEDVRQWHPGQDWIWQPGGFGVFDPGINALSVLTEVLGERVRLLDAALHVPSNRAAPIGVVLSMSTANGVPIAAEFDWRQAGPPIWQIAFEAGGERHLFGQNGHEATAAADEIESSLEGEYPAMYRHFVDLIRMGTSDVDVAPLQLVADACLRGTWHSVEPFVDRV